jgi:hypothetical protein
MRDCEHFEILISAWHDSELDRGGQEEMLDHLVRCPGCRDFYLGARGLAGLVAVVRNPSAAEAPSPEVWKRIERSARSPKPGRRLMAGPWKGWFPAPAWGAAAAVAALVVIFSSTLGKGRVPSDTRMSQMEVRLGEDPDGMNDEQFFELTKRVLGADRKYRTAFYEIMKQVAEDTQGNERSSDLLFRQREKTEGAETPETVHGPS